MLLTYSKISEGVLLYVCRVSNPCKQRTKRGKKQYPVANPVGAITNLVIAHHVQQRDNVGPARQVLQNLDLALYLLLLDRLEDFDDAFLVVDDVDALKHLRVLSAADFADHLVVFEHAPGDVDGVVVPVRAGHVCIHICVDAGDARGARRVVQRHADRGSVLGVWRRAGSSPGRGLGGRGSRVVKWRWWGEEADAGGTKDEDKDKASKHGERYCLVPGE